MIAMFRQQYKTVMLKCCCSFIKSCSKHFCIYCYLPVTCFCICSSPCIKLHIFCIGLHICPYLLVIIHITFPSLQSFALQYSFGTMIRFLSSFSFTHFSCSLFCQQPFLIFILYNIRCQLNVFGKCIKPMLACKSHFIFCFYLNHAILIIAICYC